MANIQNIPLNERLRYSNPKINQNFQNLNSELTDHINSKNAHAAQNITYQGAVATANDAKDAIDKVYDRISEIVAQSGNDNTEIVDARGGYPVLGDRLNNFDAQLSSFALLLKFGASKDSTVIQTALDYAESLGGTTIFVPPGIYSILATLRIPSNTKLIGLGQVTFKRMAEISAILINKSDGTTGEYYANSNIEVDNITFDSNNTAYTSNVTALAFGHCSNVSVKNCHFVNNKTWHDLELNSTQNSVVYNCLFDNYQGTTEMLQLDCAFSDAGFPWFGPYDNTSCLDITIEQCKFYDPLSTATCIGNHSFVKGTITQHVKIINNTFINAYYGVNLGDISALEIANNKFREVFFAVVYTDRQNDCRNWRLSENTFIFTKNPGSITDGRFFFGSSNTLVNKFEEITIVGNNVNKAVAHGIGFTSTGRTIIANNTIRGCGRNGIYLYGAVDTVITSNSMSNNNANAESGRADIVIGNAPMETVNTLVASNSADKILIGTNVKKAFVTNNQITSALTNNAGAEGITKNNIIAGVWTA